MNAAILALGLYPSSGGPAKSVRAFASALDASVISWVDPIQHEREQLIWDQTTVVRGTRMPLLRQLLVPRADDADSAERIIAGSGLVSCHSFWRWHNIWLSGVARRHRVPYWFVPHGGLDPYVFQSGLLAKKIFLSAARPFLANAAAVVCATQREYQKIAAHVPGIEPIVLPWPLDDSDFRERDEAAGQTVRRALGISDAAFCLLYFGRLDPMKRPLETIDAVAATGIADVHLVMIGNEFGVSMADCVQRANERRIGDRVHVVGPKYGAEKNTFLDACDAYISLSHRENFNFTAAECLASGLPVILSPGNDLAGELVDADCGRMLAAVDEAAEAIAQVHAIGALERRRKGANGRRWAEAHLRADVFRHRLKAHAAAIAGKGR